MAIISSCHDNSSIEAKHPTQHIIGHFGDYFYRSYDQINSVKALKETSWSFSSVILNACLCLCVIVFVLIQLMAAI